MNISSLIKGVKQKADTRAQRRVNKEAYKLEALRKERIKQEGRAKILSLKKKEEDRIKKAKAKVQENSQLGKLKKDFANYKKEREKKQKERDKKDSFGFGGRNVFE